jgi:hypothetical protein
MYRCIRALRVSTTKSDSCVEPGLASLRPWRTDLVSSRLPPLGASDLRFSLLPSLRGCGPALNRAADNVTGWRRAQSQPSHSYAALAEMSPVQSSRSRGSQPRTSAESGDRYFSAGLAAYEITEQDPALTLKANRTELADRVVVCRTSVDLDAWQQHGKLQML